MVKLKLVKGDTMPNLVFTVKRGGVVVNLGTATATFVIKPAGGGTQVNAGHDSVAMTSPSEGIITYTFNATDLATAGEYVGELKITFSEGVIQTLYDKVHMTVRSGI